jgi:uncharacterized membrane protein YtjA (UPF0391 family)
LQSPLSAKTSRDGPATQPNQPSIDISLRKGFAMLSWALTFLVIALIAAALGFGGIAGTAAGIAKIVFFLFLIFFVISLIMGRRGPVV